MGCQLVRVLIAPKRPMHKGTLAVQNFSVTLSERVPLILEDWPVDSYELSVDNRQFFSHK
ncbi:hypothetical protein Taro_025990 [Colocasia esculenta]|uniref:Uncharacterized protein n=1 Tax=Colocasia esculenta TaxID=4460 RepID=A0A843VM79_COLES|nr:hypothetical protein [Colocasia esculenta]